MGSSHGSFKIVFWENGFAILVVGAATAICFAMFPFFELTNLVMIYLLGTLIVAARGSRISAAASAILSVLCFDFCFVPPRFTFSVADVQYLFTFAVMFSAAMVISHLTIRFRQEAEAAREGQRRMQMVHALTEQLASARGLEAVLAVAVQTTAKTFHSKIAVLMPGPDQRLEIKATSGPVDIDDKEKGISEWVYREGKSAGRGTSSLPDSTGTYFPLTGSHGQVGVLRCEQNDPGKYIEQDHWILLESFVNQIGLALEVDRLQENAKKSEIEVETERLRSSLLSSVSHDFRTPITAIVGSASTLLSKEEIKKNPKAMELLETIQDEGERLSRLVQNLLETTRLESGRVQLKKELYPLEEVVGGVLDRLAKPLSDRQVKIHLPENLPLVPLDPVLLAQVFMNLLENAVRHTPPKSRIDLSAVDDGNHVTVSIADEGSGLKKDEIETVFDKFTHGPSSTGVGLGLAICRAIVTVHGGRIWVENRPEKGAVFKFTLPLDK